MQLDVSCALGSNEGIVHAPAIQTAMTWARAAMALAGKQQGACIACAHTSISIQPSLAS